MSLASTKPDRPASVTDYYNKTVADYDSMHGSDREPQHTRALELAWPIMSSRPIKSILDVGCGTGLALAWFAKKDDQIALAGVDPSTGMLAIAHDRVPTAQLSAADGEKLPFDDASFDVVVATGVLHHVTSPQKVIRELFRVAKKAVLISDHNDFAMGPGWNRRLRLGLYAAGILPYYYLVRQYGRRARYSEEDGWFYPFSLLNHWDTLSAHSEQIVVLPTGTRDSGKMETLMLNQSHLATLCFKKQQDN